MLEELYCKYHRSIFIGKTAPTPHYLLCKVNHKSLLSTTKEQSLVTSNYFIQYMQDFDIEFWVSSKTFWPVKGRANGFCCKKIRMKFADQSCKGQLGKTNIVQGEGGNGLMLLSHPVSF